MKKRTPRTVRDPFAWINKRMPLAGDQQRDIALAYRASLTALMTGHGTEQAWSTLACSINIALLLAEQGINAEALPIIKLAQESLLKIRQQALASGEWAINLPHHLKQALTAAIDAHDEQCAASTKAQLSAALHEVHRRVDAGEVFTTAAHHA